MSRTTAIRRGAAALGASGLIALSLAGPAAARPDPGPSIVPEPPPTYPTSPSVVRIDDNAFEYVQIGAGLLAGMALAGAGAAVASRRNHTHVKPA